MSKSTSKDHSAPSTSRILPPESTPLTERQAKRLAQMSELKTEVLTGRTIQELSTEFKWRIDPELLFMRKICGQVVKVDPATGLEHPVPYATVHIEDTDCSYLGFFPAGSPWHWLHPFYCHREEIGATRTDACGRFCVWVPRFEIDWILRWRLDRHCYLQIFRRPSLQDLLEHLGEIVAGPEWPPKPDPDPGPWRLDEGVLQRLEKITTPKTAQVLRSVQAARMLGQDTTALQRVLAQPAFAEPMPPPISKAMKLAGQQIDFKALALEQGVAPERAKKLEHISARGFIGPFLRCHWHLTREWTPILDVPDITFRVTQDVDGDGVEENIYSEGFFQVRWDSGSIPPVKIQASSIAVASPLLADPEHCSIEVGVPDGAPIITLAGLHPLHNVAGLEDYINPATGYAERPNPPRLDGSPFSAPHRPATAPFLGTLQLYGNNLGVVDSAFYRLVYTFAPAAPDAGAAVVDFAPFKYCTWPLWRWIDTPAPGHLESMTATPDSNGWYPILPEPATESQRWLPAHLLLNWPAAAPGLYTVKIQFAKPGPGASKVQLATESSTVKINVDNQPPTALIHAISWRIKKVPEEPWTPLAFNCGNVTRHPGETVQLRVEYTAAALHLRDMYLYGTGCGGRMMVPIPDLLDPSAPKAFDDFDGSSAHLSYLRHWHTAPDDNTLSRADLFEVPGTYLQGAYALNLVVNSRAFSPAGYDGGYETNWMYDTPSPYYRYTNWYFAIMDKL